MIYAIFLTTFNIFNQNLADWFFNQKEADIYKGIRQRNIALHTVSTIYLPTFGVFADIW